MPLAACPKNLLHAAPPPPPKCFAFTEDPRLPSPSSSRPIGLTFETSFHHLSAAMSEVEKAALSSLHRSLRRPKRRERGCACPTEHLAKSPDECSDGAPSFMATAAAKKRERVSGSAAFAAGESVMSGRAGEEILSFLSRLTLRYNSTPSLCNPYETILFNHHEVIAIVLMKDPTPLFCPPPPNLRS